MVNFSYDTATYARSRTGIKKVCSDLQADIKRAGEKITGSEYTKFVGIVRKYWAGADAEKFIESFKRDVHSAKDRMKKISDSVESAFVSDYNQFRLMQHNNANNIK